MHFAEMALLRWLFDSCGVDRIYASVLSNNPMAIRFHGSAGFSLKDSSP